LIPLFVFIFTFCGIVLHDFYAFPSPIAVLIGYYSCFLLSSLPQMSGKHCRLQKKHDHVFDLFVAGALRW
jgi:Na+/H+ antiporter NhaC